MGLAILLHDIITHWQKTPKEFKQSKNEAEGSLEGTLASTSPKFNPKVWLEKLKINRSRSAAHHDRAYAEDLDKASTIAPSPVTTPGTERPPRIIRVPSGVSG
jgi:hypothetical protein